MSVEWTQILYSPAMARVSIWHMCLYGACVYVTHGRVSILCIWHRCLYGTYVYMACVSIWHMCLYDPGGYIVWVSIWHMSLYDMRVYMTCVSIWHRTSLYGTGQVYMAQVFSVLHEVL